MTLSHAKASSLLDSNAAHLSDNACGIVSVQKVKE